MQITLKDGVAKKFRDLLDLEGEDAVIRIREVKVGAACKAKIMLRASIDERNDEDVEVETDSIPIVLDEELVDQYGTAYTISLCPESGIPVVEAIAS